MTNGGKNQLCSIQSINLPIKKTIYSLVCVKNAAKTKFFNIFDTFITLDLAEKVSNYLRFGWISICIYRHRDSPNKQFARKQPISLSIEQTLFKFIRVSKRRNYKQSINQSDFITCAHRQSLFVYGLNKRCMEYNIYC